MAGDPSQEQSAAREEVMKCEKEIQSIKAALRRLGGVGNADEPNSLGVVLIKVCRCWGGLQLKLFANNNPLLILTFSPVVS
jgi:hypothetical protein